MSGAVFADAGSLFGAGARAKALNTQCGSCRARSRTGACSIPASASPTPRRSAPRSASACMWDSPLGPLRLDIAKAIAKESLRQGAAHPLRRLDASSRSAQHRTARNGAAADSRACACYVVVGASDGGTPLGGLVAHGGTWSIPVFSRGRRPSGSRSWRKGRRPACGPAPIPQLLIHDVQARSPMPARGHVTFLDNRKYLGSSPRRARRPAWLRPRSPARVPQGVAPLVMAPPYRGFALALQHFYPDAMMPKAAMTRGRRAGRSIRPRGSRRA